jgi:hypothetical protein
MPRLLTLLSLFVMLGCSSSPNMPATSPVTGKVVFANGQPVTGAYIRFVPAGSTGSEAEAELEADGAFTMKTTVALSGVVPSKYKVVIDPKSYPAGPENKKARAAVPVLYWSAEKTPLTAEVMADVNVFNFKIE